MFTNDDIREFQKIIQPVFACEKGVDAIRLDQFYSEFDKEDYCYKDFAQRLHISGEYNDRNLDSIPQTRYIEKCHDMILLLPEITEQKYIPLHFSITFKRDNTIALQGKELFGSGYPSVSLNMNTCTDEIDDLRYNLSIATRDLSDLSGHEKMALLKSLQSNDPDFLEEFFLQNIQVLFHHEDHHEFLSKKLMATCLENKHIQREFRDNNIILTSEVLDHLIDPFYYEE